MEIPRHWRLKAQRYRLEGSICRNCGHRIFPSRPVCPDCGTRSGHMAILVLLASISTTESETQIEHYFPERILA
jgi:ribosomal protein L32